MSVWPPGAESMASQTNTQTLSNIYIY
jgi:hypothetical protein